MSKNRLFDGARFPSLGRLTRLRAALLDSNAIAAIPAQLLLGCSALQTLSLHGNPVTLEVLQSTDGWAQFNARQLDKQGKRVAGGVLLGADGLDDGIDHNTTRISVPHRRRSEGESDQTGCAYVVYDDRSRAESSPRVCRDDSATTYRCWWKSTCSADALCSPRRKPACSSCNCEEWSRGL